LPDDFNNTDLVLVPNIKDKYSDKKSACPENAMVNTTNTIQVLFLALIYTKSYAGEYRSFRSIVNIVDIMFTQDAFPICTQFAQGKPVGFLLEPKVKARSSISGWR
jgi:hypothetical protein